MYITSVVSRCIARQIAMFKYKRKFLIIVLDSSEITQSVNDTGPWRTGNLKYLYIATNTSNSNLYWVDIRRL